jgi:hypothetical protein
LVFKVKYRGGETWADGFVWMIRAIKDIAIAIMDVVFA